MFADYPSGVEPLNLLRGSAIGEATDYYHKAYDFDPNWVAARNRLRIPPQDAVRLDEAIDHYRQAIRLEPGGAHFYGALGQALLAKWQFAEADAAIGRCLELLPPDEKNRRGNLERLQGRCCHLLALEGRLNRIVRGTDKPAPGEFLDAAELCFVKHHYSTAARLYAEALAATPQLTEDLRAGHRFNAARAAALASGGQGDDAAGLGEPERAGLRKWARDWLRLDLAAWAKKVDTGTAADRFQARRTLRALAGRSRPGPPARPGGGGPAAAFGAPGVPLPVAQLRHPAQAPGPGVVSEVRLREPDRPCVTGSRPDAPGREELQAACDLSRKINKSVATWVE